jgi:hypothetical protein
MRAQTIKQRPGFLHITKSQDYHGTPETKVIPFSSDKELIDLLRREGISDEEDRIAYRHEGNSYHCFPADKWAEFVLDSIYGGMNGFMGDENDIYPFADREGWYGWVSKMKEKKG